jgi:hypothetical protein
VAEADELNIFINDGAISLRLGDKEHTEPALKLRSSAQWSALVAKEMMAGAQAQQKIALAKTPEEVAACVDELAGQHGLARIAELVIEHGVPAELVEDATAAQVMEAFRALYALENPQIRAAGRAFPPTGAK